MNPTGKWFLVAGIVAVALLLEAAIYFFVMPRSSQQALASPETASVAGR